MNPGRSSRWIPGGISKEVLEGILEGVSGIISTGLPEQVLKGMPKMIPGYILSSPDPNDFNSVKWSLK